MRLEARRDLETALPTFLRERLGVPRPIASIRESIVKVVACLFVLVRASVRFQMGKLFYKLRSPLSNSALTGTVVLLAP